VKFTREKPERLSGGSGPDFAQGSGRPARNARKKVSECMAKEPKAQTQPIVVIFPVRY
jgi:hypothetical protein